MVPIGRGSTRTQFRILITHSQVPKNALDIFNDKYELVFSETKGSPHPSRETLLNDIKGVDGVLWFSHIHIDKEMIDTAGPQLKVVGGMSAGYDHIDVNLLKERNILFSNAPGVLGNAVADMAIGLILAASRNILQGFNAIISNKWVVNHPTWMCGPALEGSTVGIIGMGDIGCRIAKRVNSFDIAQLLYTNRRESPQAAALGAKFVPLDQLLSSSDFVILVVPLTQETKHLMNMDKFKLMKPSSILINVARGGVVNQEDLVTALQNKIIGGAGLDVFTPEPLAHDHILTTLPNVVMTPHISSATFRAREAMARLAAQNIYNALNNQPLITPVHKQ